MQKTLQRRVRALVALAAAALLAGCAQAQPLPPGASVPQFSDRQLEQLVAPVALYPDEVLGPLLMAATYPLEVVEADRWLQDSSNAALRGAALVQALQGQNWDPSVKSLVAFPQIVAMMDAQLDWTEQLGDAFVAQQADVMNAVQRLRARAQAARTLVSTPQQAVTQAPDSSIEIAPTSPDTVYVPVYDTYSAYGDWPYTDYPPYDFVYPDYGFGSLIAFAIIPPLWGWSTWNWPNHGLSIVGGFGQWPGPVGARRPVGPWHHTPEHRRGVPYRSEAASTLMRGPGSTFTAPELRGYPPAVSAERAAPPAPRTPAPAYAPRMPSAPAYAAPPRAAPAFESFGRGPAVNAQEQRGASSRGGGSFGGGGGGRGHR